VRNFFFTSTRTKLGHRYFGRAKELPGVKELFASKKHEEEEENLALNFYKKFMNQGPAYFGDMDEADGSLLQYEMKAEKAGACLDLTFTHILTPHRMVGDVR
jgi:hypothetical protein